MMARAMVDRPTTVRCRSEKSSTTSTPNNSNDNAIIDEEESTSSSSSELPVGSATSPLELGVSCSASLPPNSSKISQPITSTTSPSSSFSNQKKDSVASSKVVMDTSDTVATTDDTGRGCTSDESDCPMHPNQQQHHHLDEQPDNVHHPNASTVSLDWTCATDRDEDQCGNDIHSTTSATTSPTTAISSSIMGDGYVVMREQDADLLESIQLLSSDSLLATPSLGSASSNGIVIHPSESSPSLLEQQCRMIPPLSLVDDANIQDANDGMSGRHGIIVDDKNTKSDQNVASVDAIDMNSTSFRTPQRPRSLRSNSYTNVMDGLGGDDSILSMLPSALGDRRQLVKNVSRSDMLQQPAVPLVGMPPSSLSSTPKLSSRHIHHRSRTGIDTTNATTTTTKQLIVTSELSSSTSSDVPISDNDVTIKSPMRRALSGEVWTSEFVIGSDGSVNDIRSKSESNTCVVPTRILKEPAVSLPSFLSQQKPPYVTSHVTADSTAVTTATIDHNFIRRTDSTERRMNEAAQFAEAVGEVFLPQDTTIQIIDDDDERHASDDDDDDDDDDNNLINLDHTIDNSSKQQHQHQPPQPQQQCHDTEVTLRNGLQGDIADPTSPVSSSRSIWDTSKQRTFSEVVLFASAVGEFDIAFQEDPTDTIQIIDDDDDDEYNGQNLDDDGDEGNNTDAVRVINPSVHTMCEEKQALPHQRKQLQQQQQENEPSKSSSSVAVSMDVLRLPSTQSMSRSQTLPDIKMQFEEVQPIVQRDRSCSLVNYSDVVPENNDIPEQPHLQQHQRHRFALSRRKNLSNGFLDKLPDDYNSAPATSKQLDFVYKGIKSNPPEIVKRGIARGNYAQLHRKAWLEVSDKYHRYGKNLRLYYRYWESLGFPTNMFFDWLDSKGEAAGQPLPELEECPRSKLDSDTVLYISNPQVTQSYNIRFVPTSTPVRNNNSDSNSVGNKANKISTTAPNVPTSRDDSDDAIPANDVTATTSATVMDSSPSNEEQTAVPQQTEQQHKSPPKLSNLRRGLVVDVNGQPVRTGPDGWIFVLRDNEMYGAPKVTSVGSSNNLPQQHQSTSPSSRQQRFHHSSFFGGKAVAAAGIFITDDDGILTRLYPHSGHYRPGEAHMQRVLFFLYHTGIDLRTFDMDIQQILHIARGDATKDNNSKDKSKKPKDEKETGKDIDVNVNETCSNKDDDSGSNEKGSDKIENTKKPEKKKKIESLHLMPAILVACFLAHKARFIGEGIFAQIHKIRKRGKDITNVTEALNIIDDGGCFWSSSAVSSNRNNNGKRNYNDSAAGAKLPGDTSTRSIPRNNTDYGKGDRINDPHPTIIPQVSFTSSVQQVLSQEL